MKKIILAVTMIAFLLAGASTETAMAKSAVPDQEQSTAIFNEYDYICSLNAASPERIGTAKEIIVSETENFFEGLSARAAMPDEQLLGLGYNQNEIELLKRFKNEESLTAEELRSISGTCSGSFTCESASASAFTVTYHWEWDHCPVVTLTDGAAMRWIAADSTGSVLVVSRRNTDTNIDYYWGGEKVFSRDGTLETGLSFDAINVNFDVNTLYTAREMAYAKKGHIQTEIYLPAGTNNSIHYLQVAGAYGHAVAGVGSPSISGSPSGSGSLGISFSISPRIDIDPIAARIATINRSGGITYMS